MKINHYEVVCALILNKEGKIYCCKRGPGRANEGMWEFPGGKIEPDETKEQAIIREIKEELYSDIRPIKYLGKSEYTYLNMKPYHDFSITMYGYECELVNGDLLLSEHTEAKWCSIEELKNLNFTQADRFFIK